MSVYRRLAIVAFLGLSTSAYATEPTSGSSRPTGSTTGTSSSPGTGSTTDDDMGSAGASTPSGTAGTTGTTGTSGTTGTTGTAGTAGTTGTTTQQQGNAQGQHASAGQHQGQLNDAEIMGLLDALNRAEMEQARYVLTKTKNVNVKRYAQMMIDEHHAMAQDNRAMSEDMRNSQTNRPTPGGSAGAASGGLGTTGATSVGGSVGDTGSVDPGTNTGTTAGGSNSTAGMDHSGTGTAGTHSTGAASRNSGAGTAGAAGSAGSTASTGATGSMGSTGSVDSMNGAGATGSQTAGTTGSTSATGSQTAGSTGKTGASGSMGTTGSAGTTGTTTGSHGGEMAAGTTGSQGGSMTAGSQGGMQPSGVNSAAKQQIMDASKQQLAALKQASGAELDRLYVQNAIQSHQKALDIIDGKMVATAQSPQLKQQLMQLRPELRQHLDEAQRLQSNLGSNSKSSGSK